MQYFYVNNTCYLNIQKETITYDCFSSTNDYASSTFKVEIIQLCSRLCYLHLWLAPIEIYIFIETLHHLTIIFIHPLASISFFCSYASSFTASSARLIPISNAILPTISIFIPLSFFLFLTQFQMTTLSMSSLTLN